MHVLPLKGYSKYMKKFILVSVVCMSWVCTHAQAWTLEQCVQRAIVSNISLKQTELNIQLAQLNYTQAWGGMLPNLNAQVSHGYNWGQRIDQFTNQFATERIRSNNLGISTSVTLFGGLAQYNTLKQADLNLEKSHLDYERARNDVALNVAAAYLNVLLNKEFEAIALTNRNNSASQLLRSQKLWQAGAVAENIYNDAQSQAAGDESTLVTARNNTKMALLDLGQFMRLSDQEMGTFDAAITNEADFVPLPLQMGVDEVVNTAMGRMPQIKSANLQVEAAEKGLAIAKGGAMPNLSASASYGSGYSGAAQVLTGAPDLSTLPIGYVLGSNDIVVTPQPIYEDNDFETKAFGNQLNDNVNKALFFTLTIPLFNGFANYTNIKRAEVNKLNSELQEEQAKQTLVNEVQRAYVNSTAALAAFQAAEVSEEAARKSLEWIELRYVQGMAQSIEFASARTFYDNARANKARSKYDYIFKRRILDFYLGISNIGQK
jgi:outer membrane protein